MYFKNTSPSTTCLYSAASMCPRSLSAAAQSFSSKPRLAPLAVARSFRLSLGIVCLFPFISEPVRVPYFDAPFTQHRAQSPGGVRPVMIVDQEQLVPRLDDPAQPCIQPQNLRHGVILHEAE